jgi:hypothetical protein
MALLSFVACGSEQAELLQEALFHDEFIPGQTGNWLVEGDEAGRAAVIGEQLLIEIDSPQLIHFSTLDDPSFTDFSVEADVMQLAGHLESSSGILFRMQSKELFYRFEITGNGMYLVERHNADGSWTRFMDDWTESEAIKQGLRKTNRLKVVAQGPLLTFYVNDQLLLEASDSSYLSGKIALDAGTFGQAGLQVVFDNIVVQQP